MGIEKGMEKIETALPGHSRRKARPLAALRHRNYRIFWMGQAVSVTGTWMQSIAQAWLVLELTNSAFLLGLLGAVQYVPIFLFSLIGGVIADRLPKRKLIIATQTCLMLTALVLGLLVALDAVRYWHVLVLAFVAGTATALDIPARQSFIIELTGKADLMNGIALNASVFHGARVIGPALGGLVIARFGLELCFFINAASFVAVLAGLFAIRVKEQSYASRRERVWHDIGEGLNYIRVTPSILYPILVLAGVSVFALNFNVLVPVFARAVLHLNAVGFGFLMAAHGVGALAGALFLAWVSDAGPRPGLIVAGVFGLCLTQLALAPVSNYPAAMVILGLSGWSMIVFAATVNSAVQIAVPDNLRGRVMSVYSMVFIGATPFGNLFSGAVARAWGAPAAFAMGAVLGLLSLALFLPKLIKPGCSSVSGPGLKIPS